MKRQCPWCLEVHDVADFEECFDEKGKIVKVCRWCFEDREEVKP